MRIDILTLFPEMFEGPLSESIMKRAVDKGVVEIQFHNIRDYSTDKHKKVDDYAFSGGAGMVMLIEPIARVIDKLKSERTYDEVIYMTPDGETFNQKIANSLSLAGNIIILCGHYKGVDQRVRDHYITREISIGDFVLTGGELAAAVIVDAVVRLIPGVISDETSALTDSFQDNLLSPPVYTRPADYHGWKVPDVLLSGNDKLIEEWKEQQAYERTKRLRPDLLDE
ncbi:tRNA (guanosine(37)-N1)-methyltransferase TrmD [Marinilabiliaceae bacterium JC017]|nr:tRNA (guanosine(37)-N1)-methyltransferase TrmD [Marinilabiliaceae bacterium JC017]